LRATIYLLAGPPLKLHGSLGGGNGKWRGDPNRSEFRKPSRITEHLQYDQTQKAPYAAMFDRLRAFIGTPDTLLISIGFSFSDAHEAARIDEGLASNPSAAYCVKYSHWLRKAAACDLANADQTLAFYSPDQAKVNGTRGNWGPSK